MSSETTHSLAINKWFTTDTQFNQLYPVSIQLLAKRHWTPLNITKLAVQFLAPHKGIKVLDIGSGVGKFCLTGAYFKPFASFYGVEQRENFVSDAEAARKMLGLNNAHFLLENFSQLDFGQYDNFYFFNSFYENLNGKEKIDNALFFSEKIYIDYSRCLYRKLKEMPAGTRVATYHSQENQVPPCFRLAEEQVGGSLKFWINVDNHKQRHERYTPWLFISPEIY